MNNKYKFYVKKLFLTLIKYKETAYHHYGKNSFSLFKFFYYSALRVNKFLVYENDLTRKLPEHNLDAPYSVLSPTIEDLSILRNKYDLTREYYCDQIYNFKTCYVVTEDNEPAFIIWVVYSGDYNRFLILPDDVVGLHYMATMPKHRGNSLSAKMLAYTSLELKRKGYRKAVSVVHSSNFPAIKAVEKAGYRRVAQIKTLGQFNRKVKIK